MNWMLYGANGYTGTLVAGAAAQRALQPVLAGRNPDAVRGCAQALGLDCAVFDLTEMSRVREAIRGMQLVLHCAGPFSATAQPMIDACLAEGVHYLDITGEISVFEYAHSRDRAARHADVVLLPGVGFDVVPSDCLAASLVDALPAATHLQLAFEMTGGPSAGTAKTGIEGFARGGWVRRDGEPTAVPLAWKSRTVPFAHGERAAVTIPWGDVYTAFVSTGVPNIEVYMSMPPARIEWLRRMRWLRPLLGSKTVQSGLKRLIDSRLEGPSKGARGDSYGELWGEARSADGRTASATMTTPNGYDLTVSASLGVVEHLLENGVEGGYYTPSLLMGSDYAAALPGVSFSPLS